MFADGWTTSSVRGEAGRQVKQLAQGLAHPLHPSDASASMAWHLGLGKLEPQRQCQQMSWIKTFPFKEKIQCYPWLRIITSGTGNSD